MNKDIVGLTIQEVAELFGVSASTIYRWIKNQSFPKGKKAPGGKRWTYDSIQYFLDVNEPSQKELRQIARNAKMLRGAA